ncbi:MAG: hypothetical protein Q4F82_03590 [bacterium]|nr:hypothetical protein [bacterium]
MKKLLIRIGMVLVMLVVLNWVYSKWFFEKDLREHSDIVELSWQVTDDSCRIIYLGESSNNHYGDEEANRRKISDFTADYFPTVKMGDLTKEASHAQTYYYMLKHIPATSAVETVVVTMNLRSFGPLWIYSKLETPLRKQLVLLEDYPPLVNRFLLAFKAYPIKTEEEWNEVVFEHWRTDTFNIPGLPWRTTADWNHGMNSNGWYDAHGQRDWDLTALACHYIKTYAFEINDDNPRVKDFDAIVDLCRERGWNLVFNLMGENVDKANELVGKDLMLLFKKNHDYLMQRYGSLEGVTVVDNLNLVRDVNFIDQDWTTEHYYEEGRRIVADHLALALREFYPDDYHNPDSLKLDVGHYFLGGTRSLDKQHPYSMTLMLNADSISPDWDMLNVAFEIKQQDELSKPVLAVEKHNPSGEVAIDSYAVNKPVQENGTWDFATFALPIDTVFRSAQKIKLYVHNFSESEVQIRNLDVSFRPAYLKARVKAQTYKSIDLNDGK